MRNTIKLSTNFVINYVTTHVGMHFNFTNKTHLPPARAIAILLSPVARCNQALVLSIYTVDIVCICVNNIVSVGFIIRIKIPSIVCMCVWYDFSASMHTQSHRNQQLWQRPCRTNILRSIRFEMLYTWTADCSAHRLLVPTNERTNVMRILLNAFWPRNHRRVKGVFIFQREWYKFILTV